MSHRSHKGKSVKKSICVILQNKHTVCLLPFDTSYRESFASVAGVWGFEGCIAVILQILSASMPSEAVACSYKWQERKEWYRGKASWLLTGIVVSLLQHHVKALLGADVRN